MRSRLQTFSKLGLVALLLATSTQLLVAAPRNTGIQGQAFIHMPQFLVEIRPGVFVGVGDFTSAVVTSFTIFSTHSNHALGHFATDASGTFEVLLPPGNYILVPDTLLGLAATPSSVEVTVRAKQYTQVEIHYRLAPIEVVTWPGFPIIPFTASP